MGLKKKEKESKIKQNMKEKNSISKKANCMIELSSRIT